MPSVARTLLALAGALTVAACSTTNFTTTWVSLDAAPGDYSGKKVAAVFLSQDEGKRKAAEDALARAITARGAQGVASYQVVPTLLDKESAKAKLREAGVEAVVLMRVTGKGQKQEPSPSMWTGAGYESLTGYSGWGSSKEAYAGDMDTIVSVETVVYSLGQDKLLWGGLSRTVNPSDLDAFVRELADAVAAELKDEGLIR